MEHVKAFQAEMDSLMKLKAPISKAKMSAITKGAMKAIKMYKHVVQIVEKFIAKCKPESKVPGLYIMDSLIRQSRHQYGVDKDLFASRFCKNICTTFQSLYKCPEEDKSKIVRVLNLWQKNGVLPTEVIQPLMDLAVDPQDPTIFQTVHKKVETASVDYIAKKPTKSASNHSVTNDNENAAYKPTAKRKSTDNSSKELEAATSEASQVSLQQMQLQQLQQLQQQLLKQTAMLSQVQGENKTGVDTQLLSSLEQLTKQLLNSKESEKPVIDNKLLDYDYGESDDDEKPAQPGENVRALQEAMLMQQLKQMNEVLQKQQQKNAAPEEPSAAASQPAATEEVVKDGAYNPTPITKLGLNQRLSQGELYDPNPPSSSQQSASLSAAAQGHSHETSSRFHDTLPQTEYHQEHLSAQHAVHEPYSGEQGGRGRGRSRDVRDRDYGRRSRSRSRDRLRRDRSRDRKEREERRTRDDKSGRERREREQRERENREKEWQRKKQGLPPARPGHVIICSCTLWIGHLAKITTERDLSELCKRYGAVSNIFLIKPRGCAYVTLEERVDANRACDELPSTKLQGNRIKVAWASPKSISDDKKLKEFWEAKDGAAYIPWGQMPSDLNPLTESGEAFLDESSLPGALTTKPKAPEEEQKPALGMDSMPSAVFSGGVMPSAEPGLNNLVSQPTVVTPTAAVSQPLVDPAGGGSINPSMQLAGGLPPGMQLIMQGQQAAAMQAGLVPVQMSDGQVRLVRPAGALPPGLLPGMVPGLPTPMTSAQQLPPGMAPGGQGLVQLPAGLLPLRPVAPVTQPGGNQLEQALHDLMSNKATIQALAGQRLSAGLPSAPQLPGHPPPGMVPTSISQVAQMQANLSQMRPGAPMQAGAPAISQTGPRLLQPMTQSNVSAVQISMGQPNMTMPPPGMTATQGVNQSNDKALDAKAREESPQKKQPDSPNSDSRSGINDRGGPHRNRSSFDDGRGPNIRGSPPDMSGSGMRGSLGDMRRPPGDMRGAPGMRGMHPGPDFRGPPPGMRGPPHDMSGPPPDMSGPFGMRPLGPGPGFGMWRGDRPPFNPRGGPPPGWPHQDGPPMRQGFSPRGAGPRSRFPFRGEETEFDRGRSREEPGDHRSRDRNNSKNDRDYDRSRDKPREDRKSEEHTRDKENDRTRIRDHTSMNAATSDSSSKAENDDIKSAKRSRWSIDPQGTTGLDDASHKLAKNTALEIAQRLANLPQPDRATPDLEPKEPVKPVVDITKVNTEETVSNVLGQLYDDDDDEEDDDSPPAAPSIDQPQKSVETILTSTAKTDEATQNALKNGTLHSTNIEPTGSDKKMDNASTDNSKAAIKSDLPDNTA
ncbi:SR-related and CTD-associated factor 4-like [Watersipora subatra]|uniref:SR-related and CTD-associated factor 4-like n=1 Tax=Watersipora subatra TaxID=2589382 RepID=UPI00355B7381